MELPVYPGASSFPCEHQSPQPPLCRVCFPLHVCRPCLLGKGPCSRLFLAVFCSVGWMMSVPLSRPQSRPCAVFYWVLVFGAAGPPSFTFIFKRLGCSWRHCSEVVKVMHPKVFFSGKGECYTTCLLEFSCGIKKLIFIKHLKKHLAHWKYYIKVICCYSCFHINCRIRLPNSTENQILLDLIEVCIREI